MFKMFNNLFGRFGMTSVSDQDPAEGDSNDPNPAGSDPGKAAGGGGEDQTPPEPPKDQPWEIDVDGEKKALTNDEMKKYAQLGFSSTQRYQAAKEEKEKNADAIRQYELVQRLSDSSHTPSEAEIKELAGMIGVDPNEFAAYLKEEEENTPQGGDKKGKGDDAAFDEAFEKRFGMTPAEAKQWWDYRYEQDVVVERQKIQKISDEAVDKDEIFGKMIVGEDKKGKEAAIKEMVAEDVFRRIKEGGQFGAELVAASVQKVRAHLTKFGTPGRPDQYPLTMGLGPSSGLPTEVMSEKSIERISAAEDGDESNFIARAMQRYLHKKRSEG